MVTASNGVDYAYRATGAADAAPQGASGMHGWAADVIGAVGKPETSPEDYLSVFFTASEVSRAAGQQVLGRISGARIKIYPDSAHGFLFQHHAQFAVDVDAFLTGV